MHRRSLITGATVLLVSACAGPTGTALTRDEMRALRIRDIRVDTAGGAFLNGGTDYRNRIVGDLEAALRTAFSDRIDGSGWQMRIEIGVLDVVGGAATATGRGQSELSATLRLLDRTGALRASVPLTVTAGSARRTLTGTAIGAITGGRDRFYANLVEGYADDARNVILG
jgi:hypothetical protein